VRCGIGQRAIGKLATAHLNTTDINSTLNVQASQVDDEGLQEKDTLQHRSPRQCHRAASCMRELKMAGTWENDP
jgi:hypothetical protein